MELPEEIAATRAGTGDPAALVGEFRRTAVLVPTAGEGRLMAGNHNGVRWIFAFTDEAALARFAEERAGAREGAPGRHGEPATGEPWEYVSVLGARLLDAVIPELDGPTGVAVNAADEDGSMLFPPARGIVPDEAAVDAAPDIGTQGEGA
ncbi:hypothetical protein [Streptomyces sp. PU-14G]|uniref:hypothetical protein n=1 Tax=Streptomyces sp. PU-14G TaxID=2800808 RepID=UPI0034DECCCB